MGGQKLEANIPKLQAEGPGAHSRAGDGRGFGKADINPGKQTAPFPLLPSRSYTSPQRICAGGIWR